MRPLALLGLLMASQLVIAQNPKVFITDSKSWEISGGFGGNNQGFGGTVKGGARPQTAEIVKTFGERCPQVTVNMKQEKADYIVLLDHEGGKGLLLKDNKVAVFTVDGDAIFSRSTRSVGTAVQESCAAILKDWSEHGSRRPAARPQEGTTTTDSAPSAVALGKVRIVSQPDGAEIEVDGSFVGNTPSTIELPKGEHIIIVKKAGYKVWERKIRLSGGEVSLNAELTKSE